MRRKTAKSLTAWNGEARAESLRVGRSKASMGWALKLAERGKQFGNLAILRPGNRANMKMLASRADVKPDDCGECVGSPFAYCSERAQGGRP